MNAVLRNVAFASFVLPGLALVLDGSLSHAQGTKSSATGQANAGGTAKSAVHGDAGDMAWQANCSRCHNAPEQLNPRITGTVIRHMRVRANLSAADERAILRFLNP